MDRSRIKPRPSQPSRIAAPVASTIISMVATSAFSAATLARIPATFEEAALHSMPPGTHLGLMGGYQWIYFKVEDTVANRPFIVKQTLQGPIVSVGIYF